jgi:hypothetical protein
MKNLIFIFCLITTICLGQTLNPSNQEVLIELQLTDVTGKPLKSAVSFKSVNKTYSFQTNENGFATFVVQMGENYKITVPNSRDSYDYEIPEQLSPILKLPLTFEVDAPIVTPAVKTQSPINQEILLALGTFNLPEGKLIEIIDEKTNSTVLKTTKDTFQLKLLTNHSYRVKIEGFRIENDVIQTENTPLIGMQYLLYIDGSNHAILQKADNHAFFNIIYTNIFTRLPAADEIIVLESQKTKTLYQGKTGQNGTCLIAAPYDDTYFVHIGLANKVLTEQVAPKQGRRVKIHYINLAYPSTKEYLEEKKKDSIAAVERDRAYKTTAKKEIWEKNALKKDATEQAIEVKAKLKVDSNYFKSTNNVVCAILQRFSKKWNSKMIVTDLTNSMYPYMRQVLMWHCLQIGSNEDNDYVFFNDGDETPDNQKIIGQTGGIYYTDSDSTEVIIDKMLETMRSGGGGDCPENNVEALIFAQKKQKKASELILIADNFAPVKDLRLLKQLNVPVRVLVCGLKTSVHPDYIEIAYHTKGSLHTIEVDIMTLSNMVEGKILRIGNQKYLFSEGKFYRQN